MREIDKTQPVLVTGGTGYVASWIINMLLEEGVPVHATVRDPANSQTVDHLKRLEKDSAGSLTLFKADLLEPGSFDEAMKGCQLVMHTASPFFLTGIKDPQEDLIRPAREGTRNVLESANRTPSVKRVVLTSSIVAIYGDNADIAQAPGGTFTEKEWNTSSNAAHQPYAYSKTMAEKEAWAMAEAQEQWDLLVINPGWVLGPSLSQRTDSYSIATMVRFADGTYKSGVPEFSTGIADVRDVAAAHIKAGYTPEANGRHIIVSEAATLLELANILRNHFGDSYPFPRRQVPKFIFWLIAPMYGFTRKYVSRNAGIPVNFDTAHSKTDLDISCRPIEDTVRDHFQQLLDDGLIKDAAAG